MNSIRVAPARGSSANTQVTLSRWAHHTPDDKLRKATSPGDVINIFFDRKLAVREQIFERNFPFSLVRFCVGLVSLLLLFSDILRSGLSVSSLQNMYPVLQPDEVVNSGTSWNYPVFKSTKSEASECATEVRVWSYKFDTTSTSWRAFARFLRVPEFPKCIFYHERCPSPSICGDVAFKMIDGLVNAVSELKTTTKRIALTHSGPISLKLRTQGEFIDRLHHYFLPTWFANVNWRVNQALYYSPELLGRTNPLLICFPTLGGNSKIPSFCHELWTNFNRSCAANDHEGKSVGLLHVHTLERVRKIQARFPELTVDLTLLESFDDLQICKGGLSTLAFRWSDVSTIIRARNCTTTGELTLCETLYVDDYRYESGSMTTDVVQWYRVIAALRIIGQSYFILRGVGLMMSCYYVHCTPRTKVTFLTKLRKAAFLFMKVPTQCIVYGSPFPVVCYVFAHLLDVSFTYKALEKI